MGIVYLARHQKWNRHVVIKLPNEDILADDEHRHRVVVEAQAWTELGLHSHVAYCYYVHPFQGIPLLVIEYLAGGNLASWIAAGTGTDIRAGLDLAIQACHGLEHSHRRGLIHRDIKPANMLLSSDGMLKVTDFGLVKARERRNLDGSVEVRRNEKGQTLAGAGTPEYMAPEQWEDPQTVDARADTFALGVCLYELFCGRRPYEPFAVGLPREPVNPRLQRRYGELPAQLCDLLRRCVAWHRDDRPSTMADIRRELCALYEASAGRPNKWATLAAPLGWLTPAEQLAVFHNRGVSHHALGHPAKALECFDTALRFDSHSAATWNARGKALEGLGKADDALDCYLRAARLQRQNSSAWLNHGLLLHRLGHTLQATLSYERALKADHLNAQAHDSMGVAKHQLGKLDEALKCLRQAVELAPTNAIAWSNLGFTLSALSRNDEALACYQRAIELNPQNLGAWDNIIALMERLGRSTDALSARRERERASHVHPVLTEGVELIH